MVTVDIEDLVSQKSRELLARSPMFIWAACASIWARVFVLAGPGWMRWPDLFATMRDAFSLAMCRSTEIGDLPSPDLLLLALEGFDIEDDGSTEWQHVIDLIVMISAAIDGQDVSICLQTALRSYLEGMFNVLANTYAVANGKSISDGEAKRRLANDVEWRRAVDFVRAL